MRLLEVNGDDPSAYTAEDRVVLARYSGWGGIGSSLNEYYTDTRVTASMWSVLRNLGVAAGATVLEPSCGTGVFFHTAPPDVRVVGVELDGTSARIAHILHVSQHHEIVHSSLERFATSNTMRYDAVIGNAPFGIRGEHIRDDKRHLPTAEQYFLDTCADKLAPGGVLALIVPTDIMDGQNTRKFREDLLRKAEFIGAHRLPNTAFGHAHTEVVTDVVFFRRRQDDVAGALLATPAETLKTLSVWDREFISGSYFARRGCANVHGQVEEGWRAKAKVGRDFTVIGEMDGVADKIAAWTPPSLPLSASPGLERILNALKDDPELRTKAERMSASWRPYAGPSHAVAGETISAAEQPTVARSLAAGADLAGLIDYLFNMERSSAISVDRVASLRISLQERLKEYVAEFGIPARDPHLQAAALQDKRFYRLIGAVHPDGSFSDLVTGPVAVDAVHDQIAVAARRLVVDREHFTADALAGLWGGELAQARRFLLTSQEYAIADDGMTWMSRDEYLSGDLYDKWDALKAVAATGTLPDEITSRLAVQAQWLEETIGPRTLEDVEITMRSAWVPIDILAEFLAEKTSTKTAAAVTTAVTVTFEDGVYTIKGSDKWGYAPEAIRLTEKYLNRLTIHKNDWPRIEELDSEFKEWICGTKHRERVEDLYNRKYRGLKPRTYSDQPIEVPGLTRNISLNPYHWPGIRWALAQGKGIIAADVGLGKTIRALIIAKLLRTMGLSKKPLIVVPKSVLANWVAEIEQWFPGSKILTVGETVTRTKDGKLRAKADGPPERKRKWHNLSQTDYDFILITYPAFNEIDLDPLTKGELVERDFWVQRADKLDTQGRNAPSLRKAIVKIREAYKQAVAKRDFIKRTDAIYFNDIGVDAIFVDEAANYKNLWAARSRRGGVPKFLGGSGQSDRALDLYLKAMWLRQQHDGKGVYGLTATPTKNSPLEVYSMLAHVAPEAFERIGIRNSEEFIDRFCEFKEELILTVSGEIERANVTVGFKNMIELRDIMKLWIDHQTADDVGLRLPAKDERMHFLEMSETQQAVYATLREQARQALRSQKKSDSAETHIFSIMDRMAKAAMDLEILNQARYAGERSPKYAEAAQIIAEGARAGGGQIVFADYVATHQRMVDALVAEGIPREWIAIINAQETESSASRQNVVDEFRGGKVRIVIGNTPTMGEGVNLQFGTTDIHHLDLPWEPASLQQRNGRGLRQGNINDAVRQHYYMMQGSFDGYRHRWLTVSSSGWTCSGVVATGWKISPEEHPSAARK